MAVVVGEDSVVGVVVPLPWQKEIVVVGRKARRVGHRRNFAGRRRDLAAVAGVSRRSWSRPQREGRRRYRRYLEGRRAVR